MITRWRTTGFVAALLLALLLALPGAARADSKGPTLEAKQSEVEAGRTLKFTGKGFSPNKVVSVWASKGNDNYKDDSRPVADDDGEIKFDFSIPNDIETGQWVMNAEDTANIVDNKPTATASFNVTGTSAKFDIQPSSSARAGTKFSFTVGGFSSDKKVVLEFVGPDAKLYKYDTGGRLSDDDRIFLEVGKAECEGVEAESGKVTFCWQSPSNMRTGRWLVRLIGAKSSRTRVLGLNITAR